ncbi:MAG TPA: asparagine synthase (glutamine-hydrolyzing) [Longimicrobium sp.]|nr:asparagine synthase (glutamine-hydrolyzing) [Longimicrobium sp.]
MCGFSALVGGAGDISPALARAMTRAVRHRGPDDEGYVLFGGDAAPAPLGGPDTPADCFAAPIPYAPGPDTAAPERAYAALGHRRLSILDLSPAGHQPMSAAGGRHWLVFNGEVYNYLELRDELKARGHRFTTDGDTEVVLAAYREWGAECLHHFNGMFAFALVDLERRVLFAARDRFGVKPLYYWVSPAGLLAMGSEIKQFATLPGWTAALNGQRAYDFLNWRVTDHTPETLFAGVRQLRGGECVEIPLDGVMRGEPLPYRPGGTLPARRWYRLRAAEFEGSFEEAAARFGELLLDSVGLRLRADVPVGSCLSGGLDSSAIVCAMDLLLRRGGGGVQKTFSACARQDRYDERRWVEQVVRHTGVEPHYVYPGMEGAFDELPCLTWHQDEPFGSTSIYAQWNVFRLARQNGVTVMLDGQGADEQLAGYHTFFGPLFAGLLLRGRWRALAHEVGAAGRVHGYTAAAAARMMAPVLVPAPLRRAARRLAGRTAMAPDWLDLELLGARPSDPLADRGASAADMRGLSRAQLTATNLQMLLHWEDRDSMAHSIESRVPFLDYRLVEFVLGLPDRYKISGGVTKRVLRESMRGLLPEPVRTRMDKMGFVTPEEHWMRSEAPGRFRREVARAVEASRGVVLPSALERVERMIDGREPFEPLAWRVVSFGAWMEAFGVDPGGAAR